MDSSPGSALKDGCRGGHQLRIPCCSNTLPGWVSARRCGTQCSELHTGIPAAVSLASRRCAQDSRLADLCHCSGSTLRGLGERSPQSSVSSSVKWKQQQLPHRSLG